MQVDASHTQCIPIAIFILYLFSFYLFFWGRFQPLSPARHWKRLIPFRVFSILGLFSFFVDNFKGSLSFFSR